MIDDFKVGSYTIIALLILFAMVVAWAMIWVVI
jgi:hypothetical protein